MEALFMASAGTVSFLALFIWATVKEKGDRNVVLVILCALLGSTVIIGFHIAALDSK